MADIKEIFEIVKVKWDKGTKRLRDKTCHNGFLNASCRFAIQAIL